MAKLYRPNVAAIVLSSYYPSICEFFIGERLDVYGAWQFPQGGIDEGEDPIEALYRELEEEIGTNDVEVLAQYPQWLHYDFPRDIAPKMHPYSGQIQRYFLLRLNPSATINLNTTTPEFVCYDFVRYDELFKRIKSFKKDIYMQVLDYFKKEGYLQC